MLLSPYLTWVLIFFVTPTAILWLLFWKHLYKYIGIFVIGMVFAIIIGLAWDVYAVVNHIWSWPASCCNLARLPYGIPSEEIIWAISMALYICTVTIIARDILVTHKRLKRQK